MSVNNKAALAFSNSNICKMTRCPENVRTVFFAGLIGGNKTQCYNAHTNITIKRD